MESLIQVGDRPTGGRKKDSGSALETAGGDNEEKVVSFVAF